MKLSQIQPSSWLPSHWVKNSLTTLRGARLLVALAGVAASQVASAQTLLLQLKAANYNPTNGLWTATVGANAQASGTYPTLTASASPNGSPAVVFNGGNQLALATSIPAANGYTAFAYIKPASGAGPYALFGGASGAFEYRIYNSKQDALKQQTTDLGSESTTLSTSAFSLVAVTVTNVGGGSYRLNGVNDGNNLASSFSQPISAIGSRASSGGENYNGSICEIDIYSGVLTPTQITNIEQTITNSYVTPPPTAPILVADTTPNPAVTTVGGNETFSAAFTGAAPISYQWRISPNSSGSGASPITGATNTTLVLTNLQLANSGYYYSVQATNTVAPYVTNSSWVQLTVQPLTALVQLQATNYNASSGVWTDSSGNGNNATFSGTNILPTLVSVVTPNGSPAVNIPVGGGSFLLSSSLSQSSGYTVFAYVMPSVVSDGGRHALTGGSSSGALEYDIYSGHQDYLREYLQDVGNGTATIPTNSFSMIDVAVNSSGATFRLNGATDATVAGASFGSALTRIGNNEGSGDSYLGDIAEIDIYNGALTYLQITNIEAQLTAKYITANSIVIGAATVSPTNNTYAGNAITLAAPVIGATGTTTYHWQTDNGSGGATFANISGATATNYVLNTTGLLGTYEYQLVGIPFGGNTITSAPVTLTVQAASAPVIVTDTTASPSTPMVGGNVTLSASFTGNTPIGYQWQVSPNASGSSAVSITAATNTTLVISNVQLTNSGYYYSLRATNGVSPYVANSTWYELVVNPLTAAVQLLATNYDPGSGTWTDSSGNGNTAYYSGSTLPTAAPYVTPNGSAAVNVTAGGGSFVLSSSLDPSSGYTVFAYLQPSTTSGRNALTGGSASGALEYDIYNGKQDYLREYLQDVGTGATTIPTTNFSLVALAVNSSSATFRLNGSVDATVSGATFGSPITRIGNNEGAGDSLVGEIAEVDIFTGVLTSNQISAVEAQLTAKYITANTIVIGLATVSPTNTTFAGNPITLAAPVIGATGTTTYRWQTDNGTGGASFSNISGATTTNYVLNTAGLLGTYEYQLVGTPFGGNSVTSAPVTLTVQAASAPVLVTDTTASSSVATVGGNETFSASFVGNLPISYQWQVSADPSGSGAVNLPGATNGTLVLNNLQLTNSGYYYSLRATNTIAPYVANSTWTLLTVQPLTALVQLIATNYDAGSSVWTDSSGNNNNATYSGSIPPTLATLVTPNGGSAVSISGRDGSFVLTSSLDQSSGYTVFAYLQPASTTGRNALTGGSASGALEYDLYNGKQDYLREYLQDVGNGAATIPTTGFSLVDLAVNSSGATFRLNGAADGTVAGATFSSPITRLGNNEGAGDGLAGEIAEIDIYSGVLSSNQISSIEAQLVATYTTLSVATNPTNITTTVVGSTLQLAWPADHTGWTLEAQTNSLGVGLSTNWVRIPGSSTANQLSVPIVPGNGSVFYRLVYP